MFRVIVGLSVGLIVACSGGAAAQDAPAITPDPTPEIAGPGTPIVVPSATPSPAAVATPTFEPSRSTAECLTALVFAASFHVHDADASIYFRTPYSSDGLYGGNLNDLVDEVSASVNEPRLLRVFDGPGFMRRAFNIQVGEFLAQCSSLLDQTFWEQLSVEYDTTP